MGIVLAASPASAGINPNTTYEYDCTTALQPGQAAPFAITANLNGAPSPSFPTSATFGASGALSITFVGGLVAGLESNNVVGPSGVGATITGLNIASTDGTATGSYSYSHTFPQTPPTSHTISNVTWTNGSTTLSGNFAAGDVGEGLTGGTGLPTGATVVAVNPGVDATISAATSAAQASPVTLTAWDAMTFTDAAVSTGNVFTTAGVNGGQSNIGLTTISTITVNASLAIPFGGAPGVGSSNCLETGWDSSFNPGPAQSFEATPGFPPGQFTPLVAASGGTLAQPGTAQQITPPTAAFVALGDPAPTANSGSANLGVGGSKTITLSTTDTDATPTTGCSLVGAPSDPRLSVTINNTPSTCSAHLTDAGSGPAIVTFQFNATDGVTTSASPGTETVNIGTPPVDEPLTQQVNAGQLVLSCNSPETYLPGSPLLTCPEFQFPDITLNGLQQTTTGAGHTLYVSDNRGDPTVGWTLTASFVATPIGAGSNTNASCAGVIAFCNADVGAHALDLSGNGQINKANLAISSIGCAAHAGNLNPAATAGAGGNFGSTQTICTAAATQSGGTFDVTKTYTLTIPSSVYAGNYWGTVEFLVS
jgi:hypothetical protein